MKRRETEIFNLSFLDVLSGALGAVLFLFIVVPKGGGESPAAQPQLNLVFDTSASLFYGEIPDSLLAAEIGDSLLSIVFNYGKVPTLEDCPPQKPCPDNDSYQKRITALRRKLDQYQHKNKSLKVQVKAATTQVKKIEASNGSDAHYGGDLPSVPCKFSFEIQWDDIADNVDLYVCKEGACVYGGRRRNTAIGFWDSGKSKTSIFGGDLRTTQEAVRQFDAIIPGQYTIYIQYKDSEKPKTAIVVNGLVYTNTEDYGDRGERFIIDVPYNNHDRMLLGKLTLNADGTFNFTKQ